MAATVITPPELEAYVERLTTPAPAHLAALHEETRATQESPQMLSGTVEGRFLEALVWAAQPRLVLEIGTYTGSAAQFMAGALPEGGRVVTCELDPGRAAFARRHMDAGPCGERIEIAVGPALESIAAIEEPVDLAFIDADKAGYVGYYEAIVPKLAPHGLIAADNTLFSGEVLAPSEASNAAALAAFNEHVASDPRTVQVMLPVRDGITLIRLA